jgi:hypothetical protein
MSLETVGAPRLVSSGANVNPALSKPISDSVSGQGLRMTAHRYNRPTDDTERPRRRLLASLD